MVDSDDVFGSLPPLVRTRIDEAFKRALKGEGDEQIPLEAVPSVLAELDLAADEEVLGVFENAATGWKSSGMEVDGEGAMGVSLEDWRAVCAVLLEGAEADEREESELEEVPRTRRTRGTTGGGGFLREEDEDEEEYDESDASSDEFVPERAAPGTLSAEQKRAAMDTFALFFPDVEAEDELLRKRIMIKDIQRVSELLKEKLRIEEVSTLRLLLSPLTVCRSWTCWRCFRLVQTNPLALKTLCGC